MAANALIFDVDGTMWDSYPWYAALLARISVREETHILERLRGGSNVVHLHREFGISRAEFVKHGLAMIDDLSLYDAVPDTLVELRRRGCKLGVVTSLPESIVSPFLKNKKLFDLFETVVTARFGLPPKPNPRGILTALSRLDVKSDRNVFYVGDMPTDAQAAARAGLSFAWASFGYGWVDVATSFTVLESFRDLLRL